MNCHHARQLISPYLDQQLTGREMLALQDHFAGCLSCEREMHSIRQVKILLRGLRESRPPRDFSNAVALRLETQTTGALHWQVLRLQAPKPQRGRRLATALVLSCFTVVSFALPFAPEARDAARSSFRSSFGSSFVGFGGTAFAPGALEALPSNALSGRIPERITFVSADDLTPPPAPVPPRPPALTLTGAETQPGPLASGVSQEAPFGGVQFASLRPR